MRNPSSSVPNLNPAARRPADHQSASLPLPREHIAPIPAPVKQSALMLDKTSSGRGSGPANVNKKARIPLRTPQIWEDAWEYELEHNAPPLHVPQAATLSTPLLAKIPGRNVVPFEEPGLPETIPGSGRPLSESPLKRILADINARAMTPRQMQDLSLDLYVNGILSWEEHVELAFQAELHPDFGRTIGALTGEKPLPDQPRDFVREWETRLDFERRFAPAKSHAKERALHILSVLRRIESPATLLA